MNEGTNEFGGDVVNDADDVNVEADDNVQLYMHSFSVA